MSFESDSKVQLDLKGQLQHLHAAIRGRQILWDQ